MKQVKYNWVTIGVGVIGNQLAQAMQELGGNLYGGCQPNTRKGDSICPKISN